ANGSAIITVTVDDGAALNNTVTRTFTVTVTAVKDPPPLHPIAHLTISQEARPQTLSLTGIPPPSLHHNHTPPLPPPSPHTALIPSPTITYTPPNSTRPPYTTPFRTANGSATITVTVNDGQTLNNTLTRTFTVTVTAVNDPPTLNAIANVAINENAGPQTVS